MHISKPQYLTKFSSQPLKPTNTQQRSSSSRLTSVLLPFTAGRIWSPWWCSRGLRLVWWKTASNDISCSGIIKQSLRVSVKRFAQIVLTSVPQRADVGLDELLLPAVLHPLRLPPLPPLLLLLPFLWILLFSTPGWVVTQPNESDQQKQKWLRPAEAQHGPSGPDKETLRRDMSRPHLEGREVSAAAA